MNNFLKMQTIDFTVFLVKYAKPCIRKLEKPAQPKGNVMGLQNQFVDLRVLLVKADQTEYDVFQMILDGFVFGQFERVANTQSALDQLYFNNFDLILLAGDLPTAAVNQLLGSIATGDTGDGERLKLIYFGSQDTAIEETNTHNLQFLTMNGDSKKFSDNLKRAFGGIIKTNQALPVTSGRCQRNELDNP